MKFSDAVKKLIRLTEVETNLEPYEREKFIWMVLSGLRGSDWYGSMGDRESNRFKKLTSGRIRGIVGLEPDNIFGASSNPTPLTLEEVAERNIGFERLLAEMREDFTTAEYTLHFYHHFFEALRCLKKLGYQVPDIEMDNHYGVNSNI